MLITQIKWRKFLFKLPILELIHKEWLKSSRNQITNCTRQSNNWKTNYFCYLEKHHYRHNKLNFDRFDDDFSFSESNLFFASLWSFNKKDIQFTRKEKNVKDEYNFSNCANFVTNIQFDEKRFGFLIFLCSFLAFVYNFFLKNFEIILYIIYYCNILFKLLNILLKISILSFIKKLWINFFCYSYFFIIEEKFLLEKLDS